MNCKICNADAPKIFSARVLQKYDVGYFQCSTCGFAFTDNAYWLDEAYKDAISDLDVGYATRNIYLVELTAMIIKICYKTPNKYMDYGGGYGLFVRLMRDRGFNFFRQDRYCKNIFANHFDHESLVNEKLELATAFEVFEHLPEPLAELELMLAQAKSVLFSTEILPTNHLTNVKEWWYFMPETGQHLSFYSIESLKSIAKKYQLNLYSNGKNLHLLTSKKFILNPIWWISKGFNVYNYIFSRHFLNKKSLINKDFKEILKTRVTH